jgi:hypothetical protein
METLVVSHGPTETSWYWDLEVMEMQSMLYGKVTIFFKELITVNVVTARRKVVQFSAIFTQIYMLSFWQCWDPQPYWLVIWTHAIQR